MLRVEREVGLPFEEACGPLLCGCSRLELFMVAGEAVEGENVHIVLRPRRA